MGNIKAGLIDASFLQKQQVTVDFFVTSALNAHTNLLSTTRVKFFRLSQVA